MEGQGPHRKTRSLRRFDREKETQTPEVQSPEISPGFYILHQAPCPVCGPSTKEKEGSEVLEFPVGPRSRSNPRVLVRVAHTHRRDRPPLREPCLPPPRKSVPETYPHSPTFGSEGSRGGRDGGTLRHVRTSFPAEKQ